MGSFPVRPTALVSTALALSLGLVAPSAAQSVRLLGDFQQWSAYAASQDGSPICFAMTEASAVEPEPESYTQAYLYVTNRPDLDIEDEINLVAGVPLEADGTGTASVGGQDFALFTESDAAWLDDAGRTDALASALRAGVDVTFTVTTADGEEIEQTFSLSGATAASQAISNEC